MSASLLAALDGLKESGPGRFIAKCPAHDDRSPSLSVCVLDDGRTLVHCFAGCDPEHVLDALGLKFIDLMPERIGHHFRPSRQPFGARQVLESVLHEVAVIAVIAEDIVAGEPVIEVIRERLSKAAGRLSAALIAAPVLPEPKELKVIRSGQGA